MSFLNGNRKKGEQSQLGGSIVQVGLAATMASMLSACGGGGSGVTATEVVVGDVPSVRMQLGSLDFTIPKSGELNNVVDTSLKTFLTTHFTGNTANEIEAKYKSLKKELFGDENTTDYKIEVDGDNIYIAGTVKDANGSVTSSRLGVLEQVKGADEKLETVKLFSFESTSQDFTAATTLKDEVDKNEASHKVVIDVDGIVDALTTDGDDVFELLKNADSIEIKGGEGTDTLEIKVISKGETVTLTNKEIESIEEFVVVDGVGLDLSGYLLNGLPNEGVKITIVNNDAGRQSPLEDVSWFSRDNIDVTASDGTAKKGTMKDDTIEVKTTSNVEIWGYRGNDTITGNDGDDVLYGNIGDDVISGGSGNDKLIGGEGHDTLNGNDGNNIIQGGSGDDTITTGTGNNIIQGGLGDDKITAGDGNDVLDGGRGTDTLEGGDGKDSFFHDGAKSNNGYGFDTITDFDKVNDNDVVIFESVDKIKWIPFSGDQKVEINNGKSTGDFDYDFYFTSPGVYALGAEKDTYIVRYNQNEENLYEANLLLKLDDTQFSNDIKDTDKKDTDKNVIDENEKVFIKGTFDGTTLKVDKDDSDISFKKATIDLGKNNLDANGNWGISKKITTDGDGFKVDNDTNNHLYVAYDSDTGHMPLFSVKDENGASLYEAVFSDSDGDSFFDIENGSYYDAHNNYKFSWYKTTDLNNVIHDKYYLNLDATDDQAKK